MNPSTIPPESLIDAPCVTLTRWPTQAALDTFLSTHPTFRLVAPFSYHRTHTGQVFAILAEHESAEAATLANYQAAIAATKARTEYSRSTSKAHMQAQRAAGKAQRDAWRAEVKRREQASAVL